MFSPPGAACPSRSGSYCTDTEIKVNRIYFLVMYYPEVLLSTPCELWENVRLCWPKLYEEEIRGGMANGKGQESVTCLKCKASQYVEWDELCIYEILDWVIEETLGVGMCQSTMTIVWVICSFNAGIKGSSYACVEMSKNSEIVKRIPPRTLSRPPCNDCF